MTQRKKLSSGLLLISIGIYGLITGNTISPVKGVLFLNVETDFPIFVTVISGLFAYGIIILISSTVDESQSRDYSAVFRESESYRRWIKIDEKINRSAFKSGCIGFSLSIPISIVALISLGIGFLECIKCHKNGELWAIIVFCSAVHLPWVFYFMSLYINRRKHVKSGELSRAFAKK